MVCVVGFFENWNFLSHTCRLGGDEHRSSSLKCAVMAEPKTDDILSYFVNVSKADPAIAQDLLDACGWDVRAALQAWQLISNDEKKTAQQSTATLDGAAASEAAESDLYSSTAPIASQPAVSGSSGDGFQPAIKTAERTGQESKVSHSASSDSTRTVRQTLDHPSSDAAAARERNEGQAAPRAHVNPTSATSTPVGNPGRDSSPAPMKKISRSEADPGVTPSTPSSASDTEPDSLGEIHMCLSVGTLMRCHALSETSFLGTL